jgi:uncharacterized protein
MTSKQTFQIFNQTRNQTLADRAELARTFWTRGLGLMGRTALPQGYALIISPEWSIHTFFMRIPIDVLFVGRDGRVIGLREAMPPNRPFAGVAPWQGQYVVEMPAGVIAATGSMLGDQLEISPPL